MILLGILILLSSLGAAAVGWFCFNTVTGAVIGFLCLFLPGIYFLYQNLNAEPEKPPRNDEKKGTP